MNRRQKVEKAFEYTKAVIYCRVSSERQLREGHGLDSQEQRCIKHAKDLNLEVVKVFRDEGISGGLFERPAMVGLIYFLETRPAERYTVIFDDISRFARDVAVHLQLRKKFDSLGAKLECINLKLEDTPEGKMVETMMAAAAEYDREKNTRQVIQKQKARLESGFWPFNPPPGMRNIDKTLTPVEPTAGIYKSAIEKYRDYELGTLEQVKDYLVKKFLEHGIQKKFTLCGANRVLKQILYAGYLEYPKWQVERRKAQHEGFISYETYLVVQDRLLKKSKTRLRKDYNEDFPLRNFALCKDCGKSLTAAWYKGKTKKYAKYRCKNYSCNEPRKTINKDVIENDFKKLLQQVTPSPDLLDFSMAVAIDLWKNRQKIEDQKRNTIGSEIKRFKDQNSSLIERVTKTTNTDLIDNYEASISENLKKIRNLEDDFRQIKYPDMDFKTAAEEVSNYIKDPIKQWTDPRYSRKRLLLNIYFKQKIRYYPDQGFQTLDLPLILQLSQNKNTSKDNLVEMARVKLASKTHSSTHCSRA